MTTVSNELVSTLPMSDQDIGIDAAVRNLKGRPRMSCRSAFVHLEKAWAIRDIDPAMSLFRAITAEEEAATALIHAVKERAYDRSDLINPHNHPHKAAVFPFIVAVAPLASQGFTELDAELCLNREEPRFDVSFRLGPNHFVQIDNPLNFLMTRDGAVDPVGDDILDRLKEIAKDEGFVKVMTYIKSNANERNRILYADDEGYPIVKPNPQFIIEKLRRVKVISGVTIAVAQTQKHQAFVSACVRVFADIVTKAKRVVDESPALIK